MRRVYTNRVIYLDPDYRITGKPPRVSRERKGTTYVLRVVRRRVDREEVFAKVDALLARRADG